MSDAAGEIVERIETSWDGLMAALEGVPEERLAEAGVVGEWSVKDLLGHVAVWDAHAVAVVRRLLAGETAWQVDWEAINAREAAARAGRTVAEQRAEMERAHAELLAMTRELTAADLEVEGVRRRIAVDTYEHYDEHAAEVRAWRARAGA